jgi:hypothetical protein
VTVDQPSAEHGILLHERLAATTYYCPASGTLLTVDIHERGARPVDDVLINPQLLVDEKLTRTQLETAN